MKRTSAELLLNKYICISEFLYFFASKLFINFYKLCSQNRISVIAGARNRFKIEETQVVMNVTTEGIFTHEDFAPENYGSGGVWNDIALIRLPEKMPINGM